MYQVYKRILLFTGLIFMFTDLLLCSGSVAGAPISGGTQYNSPLKMLNKNDQGKPIIMRLGEAVEITLEGQGGTGYQWLLDDATLRYFELIDEKTEPVFTDARAGGPVRTTWRLKSMKAGTGEIKIDYFRVWEGKTKALDHFRVPISIEVKEGKP